MFWFWKQKIKYFINSLFIHNQWHRKHTISVLYSNKVSITQTLIHIIKPAFLRLFHLTTCTCSICLLCREQRLLRLQTIHLKLKHPYHKHRLMQQEVDPDVRIRQKTILSIKQESVSTSRKTW